MHSDRTASRWSQNLIFNIELINSIKKLEICQDVDLLLHVHVSIVLWTVVRLQTFHLPWTWIVNMILCICTKQCSLILTYSIYHVNLRTLIAGINSTFTAIMLNNLKQCQTWARFNAHLETPKNYFIVYLQVLERHE